MSEPNQPNAAALDAARDRLTDRVLAEALGDERPPDLSEAILDRADAAAATPHRSPTMGTPRAWITLLTTAACLTIAIGVWTLGERPATVVAKLDGRAEEPPSFGETSRSAGVPEASESVNELIVSSEATPNPEQERIKQRLRATLDDSEQAEGAEGRVSEFAAQPAAGDLLASDSPATPAAQSTPTSGDQTLPFRQRAFPGAAPSFSTRLGRQDSRGASVHVGQRLQMLHETNPSRIQSQRETFGYYARDGRRWPEPPSRDRYAAIQENPFIKPLGGDALSTFSVDVDTASYTNVRQYLLDARRTPPPAAVRVEELINYFDYGYAGPDADSEDPFAASMEVGVCPWEPSHHLVRIGVKGREVDAGRRPLTNLVFLVDVSGSMNQPNKLPLVVTGLEALTAELGENDRVAIVVYAGSEGVVLPSTSGEQKDVIRSALGRLQAGGSTSSGAGLKLAYEIAERNQIPGGVNRVVLCTDGDFNVGLTGTEELTRLVETRAQETGVFLTVLGFGRGNLNDEMLEAISGRGDGHYAYIDSEREARRVLSRDLAGTLVTIAKDVKLQVEFNPQRVASYRLIGYENRVLAAEDFNDDTKDAGEIGAGHTVTALYEVVPVGAEEPKPPVDGLKYQQADGSGQTAEEPNPPASGLQPPASSELLTLKVRYKRPEGGASKKLEFPLEDPGDSLRQASIDFRWAAAVAEFGLLLRGSEHAGDATYDTVLELARPAVGDDPRGERAEFLDLVRRARELSGQ